MLLLCVGFKRSEVEVQQKFQDLCVKETFFKSCHFESVREHYFIYIREQTFILLPANVKILYILKLYKYSS